MALNFITKLPLSKEPMIEVMYDFIIIVTNKLTKYAYFIPYFENFSTENLVYIFYKHVMTNYKFPQRIINNKDKLFTSRF
jgi:hypothetical protein